MESLAQLEKENEVAGEELKKAVAEGEQLLEEIRGEEVFYYVWLPATRGWVDESICSLSPHQNGLSLPFPTSTSGLKFYVLG